MGQTVLVSATTAIDTNIGASAADLKLNDMVKVHGFRNAAGDILASRIEKDLGTPTEAFRVRGNITGLDTATTSFKIGGLKIDYSGAAVTPNTATLVEGARVAVRSTAAPVGGLMKATKIKIKKTIEGKNGDRAEVEGVITDVAGLPAFFIVNGQKVSIVSGTTTFDPSSKSDKDLKVGVKVEAKGSFDANGVLVAKKIEFEGGEGAENQASIKFSAAMQSAATPTSITLLGKTFTVNSATRFEDVTPAATRPFNADNFSTKLAVGDHLTITAFADSTGALVARRVERNNRTGAFIQGALTRIVTFPEAPAGPVFRIQGIPVVIDSGTKFFVGEERRGGAIADVSAFLAQAPEGTIVKAKSNATPLATDTSFDATGAKQGEVEIED
jgi:hypothetical protein